MLKNNIFRGFPVSPVVKILCFTSGGTGSITDQGIKILQAMHTGKNKNNKKNYISGLKMIVTTAEEPYNRSDNINSSDSTILVIIFISLLVLKKKTP